MKRLVTLHGFMGAPSTWDASLARMRTEAEVIGLVSLGHGARAGDESFDDESFDDESFDDEVRRLLDILGEAGEPCVLAGYSLGARLALGMLALAPERFSGACLVGAHPGLRHEAERAERRELTATRARGLLEEGLSQFVSSWEALPLFASQSTLDASIRDAQRGVRLGHDARALAHSLRVLGLGDMPARWRMLAELRLPVRWLVGADDTRFAALAQQVAEVSPAVTPCVVPGAGHNLLLERPDVVAEALDELLAESRVLPALEGVRSRP